MSKPSDIFDEAAADIFPAAADPGPVTLTPAVGDPVPNCYVDIRKGIEFSTDGMDSQYVQVGISLEYLLIETGRAAKIGESFLVGDTTWTVKHILTNDGRFAKVVVK